MPSDTLKQEASDKLVPDPDVCREFNITAVTLWRWDQDVNLEFPPPVKIRNRNFRSRRLLELFKNQLIQKSLKDRDARRGKAQA